MKRIRCAGMLVPAIALATAAFAQPDARQTGKQPPPATTSASGAPQYHARASGQVSIGELAPDFELDGSNGKPVKLSSQRGRWVLLVFGDRKESLLALREVYPSLDSAGVELVGVCAEKAYILVDYAKKSGLPYLMLADVSREISELYGLYDAEARTVVPGYLILDPDGNIRMTLLGQRLPAADLARLAIYVSTRT
ncbi:MAG TPA: peroxiredoxin family protein [Candidatus Sulfotelmatobacter sp.]|nr:peroxiredoxin family protein [Candidatus Sulfotelmatobacter sp.]